MNIRDDFILKDIHKGYLVGGMIRDLISDKNAVIKDRDIAIIGAEEFAKTIAEKFDAVFIELDSENKIYRVVLKDKINYLDISELRAETIEEDLKMRDFTINAIAYSLENDEFIDVTGGIDDINNKIIRGIRNENFNDDPLRILRAYRFMATTGFDIESNLKIFLKNNCNMINCPAKERIHDEIMKLFGGNYAAKTLLEMYNDGILELIFPQVKEMEQVEANSHHHLDLIHHVIETVRQIELQYTQADKDIKEHLHSVDFGGFPRINHLKIAGFLHDIGKYSTHTIETENGKERHRFIKHDIEGAKIVKPLLKNLKFSNKQIEYISEMIQNHIYPSSVISAPILDKKVMMRYIRKMNKNVIDNVLLAKADRLSAIGPDVTKDMVENNIQGLNKLLKFYIEIKPLLKPLPKLLDGNEIMKIKSIGQSPILGEIIKSLNEAQLNGEVNTKEEAVEFVKNYVK